MIEEDAKTKWCPFARVAVAVGPAGDFEMATNRPEHDPDRCIGSACMAWRWRVRPSPASSAYPSGDGYCGLAGAVK